MNERGHGSQDTDPPDPDFEGVRRAYRAATAADAAEPPSHLDAAIRAAARRSVNAGPRAAGRSWYAQWSNQLAVAAVLVLTVSIGMLALNEPNTVTSIPGELGPARVLPRAPEETAAPQPPQDAKRDVSLKDSYAPPKAAEKPAAATVENDKLASVPARAKEERKELPKMRERQLQEAADAPAPFPAGAAPARAPAASAESATAAAMAPVPHAATTAAGSLGAQPAQAASRNAAAAYAPTPVPTPASASESASVAIAPRPQPAAPAAAPTGAALEKKSLRAAAPPERDAQREPPAAVQGVAPRADTLAPLPQKAEGRSEEIASEANPADWLKRIETLRNAGETAKAADELRRFRKRYPDFPLPEALKGLQ